MNRRCVNLMLAVALVPGAVAAQTQEEIAAAIARLDGDRLDARAIEFLIDAGKPAVAAIVAVLESATEELRSPETARLPQKLRLLRVLRAIGPEAAAAVEPLLEHAVDDRLRAMESGLAMGFHIDVVRTLGQLVEYAPEQVTLVFERSPESSSRPVPGGMYFLGDMFNWARVFCRQEAMEDAEGAREAAASLDAESPLDREFAADLLGVGDGDRIPRLVSLIGDEEQPCGIFAGPRDPRGIKQRHSTSVPQEFANPLVHDAAARAIARIDPDHPQALHGLALMVGSADDPRDRVRAAAALGRHVAAAEGHVDVLLAALDSDDDRLVAETVTALGMIGVASDEVVARLRELSTDERRVIARRAEAALRSLEGRVGAR